MTPRVALAIGSALAAAAVGVVCLSLFFLRFDGLDQLAAFADQLLVLAIMPAMIAAAAASAWVASSPRFETRGHFANAIRICLSAYPILFFVLWATIWAWLQFEHHLPPYERPGSLLRMAETAAGYTVLAFVVGVAPATVVEYFLVRSIRRRHSPALPSGAMP